MTERDTKSALAVVGMACRFPGANTPDELWRLVCDKKSVVQDAPADRLDSDLYYSEGEPRLAKSYSRRVGLVEYPDFLSLGLPVEEETLSASDPAHLMMCQLAKEVVVDAGWAVEELRQNRCGVYVGHSRGSEWIVDRASGFALPDLLEGLASSPELAGLPEESRRLFLSRFEQAFRERLRAPGDLASKKLDPHEAAALVARVWGLTGPAVVVNAACGSSLQALWLAAQALYCGDVDCALVGGANHLRTAALIRLSQAETLSRSGARPFDDDADGMSVAEGYGLIGLKRLDDAVRGGDPVLAVVRSFGIACDGRGKSFWAPRKEGQLEAIRRAYNEQTRPESIGYLEAHATGTVQGDASEVSALSEFFAAGSRRSPLPVGSIKSNIGHALEAAGMAGLIKTVMALREKQIPGQTNFVTPNKAVREAGGVLAVPGDSRRWDEPAEGGPRCAAVNSFGIGGLNLHVVLEEPVAEASPAEDAQPNNGRQTSAPRGSESLSLVGAGVLLPGVIGCEAFKELVSGKDGSSPLAVGPLIDYEYDWRRHRIPPLQIARGNPLQYRVLAAVDEALDQSGMDLDAIGRGRVGVVVGTTFDSDFCQSVQLGMRLPLVQAAIADAGDPLAEPDREALAAAVERRFAQEQFVGLLDETGSSDASTLATRVTKTHDLMGGAMAVDCGRGSSFAALAIARDMILSGQCDVVLCAAAEQRVEHRGRRNDDTPTPMRHAKAGSATTAPEATEPTEATVAFVLTSARVAQQHSLPVIATVDRVDTVDPSEAPAPRQNPTARRWGDAGAAADLLEMLASIASPGFCEGRARELRDRPSTGAGRRVVVSPPTAASESPVTPTEGKHGAVEPAADLPATPKDESKAWRIVRLGSPDLPSLQSEIESSIESAGPLYGSAGQRAFKPEHRFRIAVVAKSHIDLSAKLSDAGRRLAGGATSLTLQQQGVFAGPLPERRPRVAFLFPGQASQYDQMLCSLVESRPSAQSAMRRVDDQMRRLGFPLFRALAWEDKDALSADVWRTQMSLLMAAEILRSELNSVGVTPDFVSGHSFGEFPALVAVGAWSFESAARATHSRCVAIKLSSHSRGGMLASAAPEEVVGEAIRDMPEPVYISGYNAPDQVVCGGPVEALRFLSAALELRGYASRLVDAPCPAHTPLMQDIREPLRRALKRVPIRPPKTPFLSSVSGKFEADPDCIRQNLVDQLTQPVRYTEQIRRLAAEQVTHFVEVGPGQVLTLLHHRILPDRRLLKIASDHENRDGLQQLLCVVAGLAVSGALEPGLWGDHWAAEPRAATPAHRSPAEGRTASPSPVVGA